MRPLVILCANGHTYLLTPWCRVLPEKLTGLQLVKKFPAFHGTRRFITALISVRHLSLSWASPIQSLYTHPTSWRSILILSAHLHLGHSICNICKPKMHHCPTCKEKFLNTRNLALEDLACRAKYTCKYQAYGCTESLNCDTIVGHQVKCWYRNNGRCFYKKIYESDPIRL